MTNDKIYSLQKEIAKKQLPCNGKRKSKIDLGNDFPFRAVPTVKKLNSLLFMLLTFECILTWYYYDKNHKKKDQ